MLQPDSNVYCFYSPRKQSFLFPPQTKFLGYIVILLSVRSFVRSSVRPSQSLIHYSSKTAEQNFMKLSGIVHYMMPYCTSYFKFLSEWFWGFPEQNKDFAIQNMGEWGYHFVSIAHSISSFCFNYRHIVYKMSKLCTVPFCLNRLPPISLKRNWNACQQVCIRWLCERF